VGETAPQGVSYRPLQAGDLDAVCAIEKACFGTPWSKALFEEELARPDTCHWTAAVDAGGLLAYGGFWKVIDEAHFTNVAVRPDRQRRGLGRELLKRLLEEAAALGCKSATLEVRPSNAAAVALYEQAGFKGVALRPRYYSDNDEDALLMWKTGLEGMA
jgi:ribosomal-protein-alanine N-acetyltransferase